jgi:quercetin dioxygenase-like cupin family protein
MNKIQAIKKAINKIDNKKLNGVNVYGDGNSLIKNDLFPLKHVFADQIYLRELTIKKGMVMVGAIHNHLHIFFLLKGHLTLSDKNSVEDYEAPCYVVSKPGIQRAVYANEDSIVVNIHKNPTNNKNIEELEKELVSLNMKDYEEYINKQK